MEKKGPKPEWKASDSAPMPTKGRKGADFHNETTDSTENRFPWAVIITAFVILCIVGFILFIMGIPS